MTCPDENSIAGYLQRRLSKADAAELEAHLDACSACRAVVDDLVDLFAEPADPQGEPRPIEPTASSSATDAPSPLAALAPGDSIGRYLVLRKVGSGGFGVVYAAYDPQLDRKIALKVLRGGKAGPEGPTHERLLHEAQAMARLSHPNVTAVYDVAAFGGRIAVAMEFIDGSDLRAWLREAPRAWRDILRVFMQAGRGLAAAHAAGIVHRDFKPANVLIAAPGGRASVTDFGLASLESQPDEGGAGQVGTPAYMAPEQQEGLRATARSDQYSFGVALYEALAGERPPRAKLPASPPKAPRSQAPAWIFRVLTRALEPDPARRFPSMDELLAALSPELRSQKRRLLGAIAAVLLLSTVPLARLYDLRREEAEACSGAAQKVDEVWSEAHRERVLRAFAASREPYAEGSRASVDRALSAYMARWSLLFTESCEATRRGEQSDEVLTARMLCLEERRAEVAALVAGLAAADDQALLNAVRSTSSLSDIEACGRTAELLTQPPPPASARLHVEDTRVKLGQARALRNSGRAAQASELAEQALVKARAIDYAPLLSEALLFAARGHALGGRVKEAEATLHEAVRAASRGRHDRVAAEAWIELVSLVGTAGRRDALGLELRHAASAALDRLGGDKALEAKLASAVGLILAYRGLYPDALAEQQRALKLLAESSGAEAPATGSQLHRIAEILTEMGRHDEAREAAARSAEVIAKTYGERHPMIALPLVILADSACARGEHDACIAAARDAMAARSTASTPADHPSFLPMLLVLARGLVGAGRAAEARRELDRAERIAVAAFGASDPWVGLARRAMGDALFAEGAFEEAAAKHRSAVALSTQALGPDHPDVAAARDALGRSLLSLGRAREALVEHEQALAVRMKIFGEDSPLVAASRRGVLACEEALGRPAGAGAHRERASAASRSPERGR